MQHKLTALCIMSLFVTSTGVNAMSKNAPYLWPDSGVPFSILYEPSVKMDIKIDEDLSTMDTRSIGCSLGLGSFFLTYRSISEMEIEEKETDSSDENSYESEYDIEGSSFTAGIGKKVWERERMQIGIYATFTHASLKGEITGTESGYYDYEVEDVSTYKSTIQYITIGGAASYCVSDPVYLFSSVEFTPFSDCSIKTKNKSSRWLDLAGNVFQEEYFPNARETEQSGDLDSFINVVFGLAYKDKDFISEIAVGLFGAEGTRISAGYIF